jgi:dTDP-4-dehydrorhamnose reductase
MKRILICGSNGLIGQRLAQLLCETTEHEVLNTSLSRTFVFDRRLYDYTQLDLTRKGDVKSLLSAFRPDIVINAAGQPSPDWCEERREEAWKINVESVENLIESCRKFNALLTHISSDYVFDGKKKTAYTERDQPNPISYYGKTKLAAENAILVGNGRYCILRTGLVFGAGIGKTHFALKLVQELREGKLYPCAIDQIGSPTCVSDIAHAAIDCSLNDKEGLFHIATAVGINRYEFGKAICRVFNLDETKLVQVRLAELKQLAVRPLATPLNIEKARAILGYRPTDLSQALLSMKQELEAESFN